jgi:phosphoribosylamine--glycine ligase
VVKADGLAAGKGVVIAADRDAASAAADEMLSGRAFGAAGRRIVVEDLLVGREVSFFVLAAGRDFVELATCQDYKRSEDGDRGPNTGGMGSYSPSAFLDPATRRDIVETIVRPTLDGLWSDDRPYRGVLYVGLMLTSSGPRVLEYNVRFGDPETQPTLVRLKSDLLELLLAACDEKLEDVQVEWDPRPAVCVVLTSGGYPGDYRQGFPIRGLAEAAKDPDVVVFHAGTEHKRDEVVTAGGRVLNVVALGETVEAARQKAYAAVRKISYEGMSLRTDIGLGL